MKKLFAFLSLTVLLTSGAFAAEPQFNNYVIKRGQGGAQSDAARTVRLVRFSSQAQNDASLVSGDLVVWDTNSDDGVSVRTTTTSLDGAIAGVVVNTIQTADSAQNTAFDANGKRNWGYIVVDGFANVDLTAGGGNNCSAGDAFYTSSDSTTATGWGGAGGAYGAGGINQAMRIRKGGFFLDACDGTSTSAEVYVDLA